jgi:excisionase family DNA binding protein
MIMATATAKAKPRAPRRVSANGGMADVLTLGEAAAYLRLSEADVLQLIAEQSLPARRVGHEWRLLLAAIHDWLRVSTAPKSNREAWMALAGVWKDDPTLDELQEEIQRQRQRLMSEDGA